MHRMNISVFNLGHTLHAQNEYFRHSTFLPTCVISKRSLRFVLLLIFTTHGTKFETLEKKKIHSDTILANLAHIFF